MKKLAVSIIIGTALFTAMPAFAASATSSMTPTSMQGSTMRACQKAAWQTRASSIAAANKTFNDTMKSTKATLTASLKAAGTDKTAKASALATFKAARKQANTDLYAARKAANDLSKATVASCKK